MLETIFNELRTAILQVGNTTYTLREYVENLAEKQLIDQLILANINMQTQIDDLILINLGGE